MLPSASFRATSILTLPGPVAGISTVDQKPERKLFSSGSSSEPASWVSETSPSGISG